MTWFTFRTIFFIGVVQAVVVAVTPVRVWNTAAVFAPEQSSPARAHVHLLGVSLARALISSKLHAKRTAAVSAHLSQPIRHRHHKAEIGAIAIAKMTWILIC